MKRLIALCLMTATAAQAGTLSKLSGNYQGLDAHNQECSVDVTSRGDQLEFFVRSASSDFGIAQFNQTKIHNIGTNSITLTSDEDASRIVLGLSNGALEIVSMRSPKAINSQISLECGSLQRI